MPKKKLSFSIRGESSDDLSSQINNFTSKVPFCFRNVGSRLENVQEFKSIDVQIIKRNYDQILNGRSFQAFVIIGLIQMFMARLVYTNFPEIQSLYQPFCKKNSLLLFYCLFGHIFTMVALICAGMLSDSSKNKIGRRNFYFIIANALVLTGDVIMHVIFMQKDSHPDHTVRFIYKKYSLELHELQRSNIFDCGNQTMENSENLIAYGINLLIYFFANLMEVILEGLIFDMMMPDKIYEGLAVKTAVLGLQEGISFSILAFFIPSSDTMDPFLLYIKSRFMITTLLTLILFYILTNYVKEIPDHRLLKGYNTMYDKDEMEMQLKNDLAKTENEDPEKITFYVDTAFESANVEDFDILGNYFNIKCLKPTTFKKYFFSIMHTPIHLKYVFLLQLALKMSADTFELFLNDYIFQFTTQYPIYRESRVHYSKVNQKLKYFVGIRIFRGMTCLSYSFIMKGLFRKFGIKRINLLFTTIYILAHITLFILPHETATLLQAISAAVIKVHYSIIPLVMLADYYQSNQSTCARGVCTDLAILQNFKIAGRVILIYLNYLISFWVHYAFGTLIVACLLLMCSHNLLSILKYDRPKTE